jgi:hypothetical protein
MCNVPGDHKLRAFTGRNEDEATLIWNRLVFKVMNNSKIIESRELDNNEEK